MNIGLFGGTFNPIHIGHLIMAQETAEAFQFEKVLLIPSANPPHKSSAEVISAIHRFEMVQLAIANHPLFEISDVEYQRKGKSYTVDTIQYFRKSYSPDELHWIVGGDAILDLHLWKNPKTILENCRLIATTRPGFDVTKIKKIYQDQIRFIEITNIDISSTQIRKRIKEKKSIRYYLPNVVEQYIQKHHLYQIS